MFSKVHLLDCQMPKCGEVFKKKHILLLSKMSFITKNNIEQALSILNQSLVNCTICLENVKSPVVLNCGHTFCGECLKSHLNKSRRLKRCPNCQFKIAARSFSFCKELEMTDTHALIRNIESQTGFNASFYTNDINVKHNVNRRLQNVFDEPKCIINDRKCESEIENEINVLSNDQFSLCDVSNLSTEKFKSSNLEKSKVLNWLNSDDNRFSQPQSSQNLSHESKPATSQNKRPSCFVETKKLSQKSKSQKSTADQTFFNSNDRDCLSQERKMQLCAKFKKCRSENNLIKDCTVSMDRITQTQVPIVDQKTWTQAQTSTESDKNTRRSYDSGLNDIVRKCEKAFISQTENEMFATEMNAESLTKNKNTPKWLKKRNMPMKTPRYDRLNISVDSNKKSKKLTKSEDTMEMSKSPKEKLVKNPIVVLKNIENIRKSRSETFTEQETEKIQLRSGLDVPLDNFERFSSQVLGHMSENDKARNKIKLIEKETISQDDFVGFSSNTFEISKNIMGSVKKTVALEEQNAKIGFLKDILELITEKYDRDSAKSTCDAILSVLTETHLENLSLSFKNDAARKNCRSAGMDTQIDTNSVARKTVDKCISTEEVNKKMRCPGCKQEYLVEISGDASFLRPTNAKNVPTKNQIVLENKRKYIVNSSVLNENDLEFSDQETIILSVEAVLARKNESQKNNTINAKVKSQTVAQKQNYSVREMDICESDIKTQIISNEKCRNSFVSETECIANDETTILLEREADENIFIPETECVIDGTSQTAVMKKKNVIIPETECILNNDTLRDKNKEIDNFELDCDISSDELCEADFEKGFSNVCSGNTESETLNIPKENQLMKRKKSFENSNDRKVRQKLQFNDVQKNKKRARKSSSSSESDIDDKVSKKSRDNVENDEEMFKFSEGTEGVIYEEFMKKFLDKVPPVCNTASAFKTSDKKLAKKNSSKKLKTDSIESNAYDSSRISRKNKDVASADCEAIVEKQIRDCVPNEILSSSEDEFETCDVNIVERTPQKDLLDRLQRKVKKNSIDTSSDICGVTPLPLTQEDNGQYFDSQFPTEIPSTEEFLYKIFSAPPEFQTDKDKTCTESDLQATNAAEDAEKQFEENNSDLELLDIENEVSYLPNMEQLQNMKTPKVNIDMNSLKNAPILSSFETPKRSSSRPADDSTVILDSQEKDQSNSQNMDSTVIGNENYDNFVFTTPTSNHFQKKLYQKNFSPLTIVKSKPKPIVIHDGIGSRQKSMLNYVSQTKTSQNNDPEKQPETMPENVDDNSITNQLNTSLILPNSYSTQKMSRCTGRLSENRQTSNSFIMPTPMSQHFKNPAACSTPFSAKKNNSNGAINVACSSLTAREIEATVRCCKMFNLNYNPSDKCDITHLVVAVDQNNQLLGATVKFFYAISGGRWILNMNWIYKSIEEKKLLDEEAFEVSGDFGSPGPKLARLNCKNAPPFLNVGLYFMNTVKELPTSDIKVIFPRMGAQLYETVEQLSKETNIIRVIVSKECENEPEKTEMYNVWYQKYGIVTVDVGWILVSVSNFKMCSLMSFLLCTNAPPENLPGYPPEITVASQTEYMTQFSTQ